MGKDRFKMAEVEWDNSDLDGLQVIDADGWEQDGDGMWLKKFYYEDEENPDGDSKVATFVVIFKKNSDIIEDSHVNIW